MQCAWGVRFLRLCWPSPPDDEVVGPLDVAFKVIRHGNVSSVRRPFDLAQRKYLDACLIIPLSMSKPSAQKSARRYIFVGWQIFTHLVVISSVANLPHAA